MATSKHAARQSPAFDNHEYVIAVTDETNGLKAFIAVHSTVRGPAHGGTRMKVYESEEEALTDVLNLSKAMSYKSALANLPYGGAKGVIILDKSENKNTKHLSAYAQKIEKLGGLFRTGTDVGLTDADTQFMAKYSKYIIGLPKSNNSEWSTSHAAAKGVFNAIKAAVKHKYGTNNLNGMTVGIKGVGKLGGHLAELLAEQGALLFIADINDVAVDDLKERFSQIRPVAPEHIHKQKMHIYAPCALGDEFNAQTIEELRCEIIVGGANNQLRDDEAGERLHQKGILYVPDYIANAGGLIFVCEDLETDGFNPNRIEKRLNNIAKTVTQVLEESQKSGLSPNRVADMIARMRIAERKK